MQKTCRKCGLTKGLDQFHPHPNMKDGHLSKCRSCIGEYSKSKYEEYKLDPARMERIRGHKKKSMTKERAAGYYRIHRERFPEKFAARGASQYVVASIPGNHMHHWSYRKEHWLDLVELTASDHRQAHRYLVYDTEHMQYRTTDGVLLDTKEAHITWLKAKLPER